MGVPLEVIERPGGPLRVLVRRAKRNRNGTWSVAVSLTGRIELSGGRSLSIDRELSLSERQTGSLPRGTAAHKRRARR